MHLVIYEFRLNMSLKKYVELINREGREISVSAGFGRLAIYFWSILLNSWIIRK